MIIPYIQDGTILPDEQNISCIIYAVICPITNDVKYIGQTSTRLRDRVGMHLGCAKPISPFLRWIIYIKSMGLRPLFRILCEIDKPEDLMYWERFYMELFRSWGFELLNKRWGISNSLQYVRNH